MSDEFWVGIILGAVLSFVLSLLFKWLVYGIR